MTAKRKSAQRAEVDEHLQRQIGLLLAENALLTARVAALEAHIFGAADLDGYMTVKQAAYELGGVHRQYVHRLIKEGRLVSKKIGGKRLIDAKSVSNFQALETTKRGKSKS